MSSAAVTTVAGVAGSAGASVGVGTNARFWYPNGVAIGGTAGSFALVADTSNACIKYIVLATRTVSALAGVCGGAGGSADGPGTNALFRNPNAVAIDVSGLIAVVADRGNQLIRKIVVSSGVVTTIAGSLQTAGAADGTGTQAQFNVPQGIALNAAGTLAVVGDMSNYRVRLVDIVTGQVTTLAGATSGFSDGVGTAARFSGPVGVSINAAGTVALVADPANALIRMIDVSSGLVCTLAGRAGITGYADGAAAASTFKAPNAVSLDYNASVVYIADWGNYRVRAISVSFAPSRSATATSTQSQTLTLSGSQTASLTQTTSRLSLTPTQSPTTSGTPTLTLSQSQSSTLYSASQTPSPVPFSSGNIVALRVSGNGSSLSASAVAVILDEFSFNGTALVLVRSLTVPSTWGQSSSPCSLGGNANSEGRLTRSVNHDALSFGCYIAAAGYPAVSSSPATAVLRAVVSVKVGGIFSSPVSLGALAYNASSIRTAVIMDSDGDMYVAGPQLPNIGFVSVGGGSATSL